MAAAWGLAFAACLLASRALAWPNLIDAYVTEDRGGIWNLGRTPEFPLTCFLLAAAGALWLGETRGLGATLWRAMDAYALAGVLTAGLKAFFQRPRPIQLPDPTVWFAGPGHFSFPSGDVSSVASLVAPVVLAYGLTRPWTLLLLVAPLFDMAARVKYHAHWPTDVLAGAVLGFACGWLARRPARPLLVRLLPARLRAGLARPPPHPRT